MPRYFHDLRHALASRWLEAGMPLHHVKELLGHKSIATTDTYLNAGRLKLQESMKRFEVQRGKFVASEVPIEQRPVCHDESEESPKDPLH